MAKTIFIHGKTYNLNAILQELSTITEGIEASDGSSFLTGSIHDLNAEEFKGMLDQCVKEGTLEKVFFIIDGQRYFLPEVVKVREFMCHLSTEMANTLNLYASILSMTN